MTTATRTSKIFRTWEDRILSGRFSKSECGQWAKAVVPLAHGERAGGFKTNLTSEEAQSLRSLMAAQPGVRLHDDHTAQGLAWIGKNKKHFPPGTLDNFSHFSFQGDGAPSESGYRQYMPVWRVHLRDGSFFDYAVTPWQSSSGSSVTIYEGGF